MRERKIDLRPNEVRGIIDGLQSQIRRVIKPQPTHFVGGTSMSRAECDKHLLRWTKGLPYKTTLKNPTKNGHIWEEDNGERFEPIKFPYGKPDDRLWVRETWKQKGHNFPIGHQFEYRATAIQDLTPTDGPWKPSIFMPRAASRITLEITDIRCERLNEISEADAIAEGIEPIIGPEGQTYYGNYGKEDIGHLLPPVESYRSLWQSINGPESWEANPFFWVISFKRIN